MAGEAAYIYGTAIGRGGVYAYQQMPIATMA